MGIILLLSFLIISGMWTKHTNTMYMRKLAAKDYLKYGKPVPMFLKKNKSIFAWWEL